MHYNFRQNRSKTVKVKVRMNIFYKEYSSCLIKYTRKCKMYYDIHDNREENPVISTLCRSIESIENICIERRAAF